MKRSYTDIYFSNLIEGIAEKIQREPKYVKNDCPDSDIPFPEIKSIIVSASDYVGTVRLLELDRVTSDVLIKYILNSTLIIEKVCNGWVSFEKRAINVKRSNLSLISKNILLTKQLKKASRIISNLDPSICQQLTNKVELEMEQEELLRLKRIAQKSKKFKIYAKK